MTDEHSCPMSPGAAKLNEGAAQAGPSASGPRTTRNLSLVAIVGAAAVVVAALGLRPPDEDISARVVRCEDGNGNLRIELSAADQDGAVIKFYDPSGNLRMKVGIDKQDRPAVILGQPGRTVSTRLTLPDDSSALFEISDSAGNPRVIVRSNSKGESELRLCDGEGTSRVEAGVTADGDGMLRVRDKHDNVVWDAQDH